MGTIKEPPPVYYFASVMFRGSVSPSDVDAHLAQFLGPICDRTDFARFTYSDYYAGEMGRDLMRYFLLFEPLRGREWLAEIKVVTNDVESAFARQGRRAVNVDPGYLALEQLVLATTKGYTHRIYLGKGIYADLTLTYHDGSYRPMEWTYPDYGSKEMITLFNGWRERYKRALKCQKA